MRICGVVASLGSGGAERVMLELCAAWSARGDAVTLLTLDGVGADFYSVPHGVERHALGVSSQSHSVGEAMWANVSRMRVLRNALREARPDVIVSFTDRTNVLTLLASRALGVPVVVSERNDPRRHQIGKAWDLMRQVTYPTASTLVVQTEAVRDWANKTVSASRVAVIPNPLRVVRTAQVPAGERAPRIMALGRLDAQKGFDVLINAFALIADDYPEWQLYIVGEGPERRALETLVDARQLSARVSLPGRTTNPAAMLAASSIFALPSRYEGFPNALMEAMSHGCACVSTSCDSGPAELIANGVSGRLVPVDDVLGLAEALSEYVKDADTRTRVGNAAVCAIERFAPAAVLNAWDAVFASHVHDARRAA